MKRLHNDWKQLDADDKSFFGYAGLFLLGALFLFWLATTVKPPVKDYQTIDTQIHFIQKHELSNFYSKYSNKIYNEKYSK